jgi:hypothetical protein
MKELRIRPASKKEEQIVSRLNSLDLDDLYKEFGQHLGILAPGDPPEVKAKGWLASQKKEMHELICVKGNYCSFIAKNQNARKADIIGALSDILATVFGGIPVYTLATLLVRSGLDSYCNCEEKKE